MALFSVGGVRASVSETAHGAIVNSQFAGGVGFPRVEYKTPPTLGVGMSKEEPYSGVVPFILVSIVIDHTSGNDDENPFVTSDEFGPLYGLSAEGWCFDCITRKQSIPSWVQESRRTKIWLLGGIKNLLRTVGYGKGTDIRRGVPSNAFTEILQRENYVDISTLTIEGKTAIDRGVGVYPCSILPVSIGFAEVRQPISFMPGVHGGYESQEQDQKSAEGNYDLAIFIAGAINGCAGIFVGAFLAGTYRRVSLFLIGLALVWAGFTLGWFSPTIAHRLVVPTTYRHASLGAQSS
jgi:hypothetical protein